MHIDRNDHRREFVGFRRRQRSQLSKFGPMDERLLVNIVKLPAKGLCHSESAIISGTAANAHEDLFGIQCCSVLKNISQTPGISFKRDALFFLEQG